MAPVATSSRWAAFHSGSWVAPFSSSSARVDAGPRVRARAPPGSASAQAGSAVSRLAASRAARPVPLEAHVPPGERLVEEASSRPRRRRRSLRACPGCGAAAPRGDHFPVVASDRLHDLLDRDVAEVQVRREAARVALGGRARLRARLRVASQPFPQELPQARACRLRRRPAPSPPAARVRVQGQRRPTKAGDVLRLSTLSKRRASRASSATSGMRGFGAGRGAASASAKALWILGRRCAAADTAGPRSDSGTSRVRVHGEDRDAAPCPPGPRACAGHDEAGEVVGDHEARALGETARGGPRPSPFSVSTNGQ